MKDYSKWIRKSLRVTNILLDSENPRIPDTYSKATQKSLLHELVLNEKVYELAKNIADNGYFPNDSLITVKENNKHIVLEGNRRLAALKLLITPDAAPDIWRAKFSSLSQNIPISLFDNVDVMVAPSRQAAAPIIMSRHTLNQIEKWNPVMQDKFYMNLIKQNLDPDDIAKEFNVKLSTIKDAVQRHTMYTITCRLQLPDEISTIVQNPREFPVTTLERLYQNSDVRSFLGISFDNGTSLVGKVNMSEFNLAFQTIVSDVATKKLDSRMANSSGDIKLYLKEIKGLKPKKKGEFNAEDLLGNSTSKPPVITTPVGTKKRSRTTNALVPKSFPITLTNPRIINILKELQTLSLARYPNAIAILFRTLIELGTHNYLSKSGDLKSIIDEERIKRAKKTPSQKLPGSWSPTLKQMLKYMITKAIIQGQVNKTVNKMLSERESFLTMDTLDNYVHNQYFDPKEKDLRSLWNNLEGFLEIILAEPGKRYAGEQ